MDVLDSAGYCPVPEAHPCCGTAVQKSWGYYTLIIAWDANNHERVRATGQVSFRVGRDVVNLAIPFDDITNTSFMRRTDISREYLQVMERRFASAAAGHKQSFITIVRASLEIPKDLEALASEPVPA